MLNEVAAAAIEEAAQIAERYSVAIREAANDPALINIGFLVGLAGFTDYLTTLTVMLEENNAKRKNDG